MINPITPVTPFQLPEKSHVDSAQETFFGTVFQENTAQFATLDTAQMIAKLLGGTVVDMKDQWLGGSQTTQYAIQMPADGPLLNAGLIAKRCQTCGVEAGLSAALQEAASVSGHAMSFSDAWAAIQANEATLAAASQVKNPTKPAGAVPAITPVTTESTTTGASKSVDLPGQTASSAPTPMSAAVPDPVPATSTAVQASVPDAKLATSAKQFEALMIGQLLKSVREASSNGWMGSDGDQSQLSAVEFAESQLSEAIAAQGGFGLARLALNSLAAKSLTNPNSDS
jgi:hypothetical protein